MTQIKARYGLNKELNFSGMVSDQGLMIEYMKYFTQPNNVRERLFEKILKYKQLRSISSEGNYFNQNDFETIASEILETSFSDANYQDSIKMTDYQIDSLCNKANALFRRIINVKDISTIVVDDTSQSVNTNGIRYYFNKTDLNYKEFDINFNKELINFPNSNYSLTVIIPTSFIHKILKNNILRSKNELSSIKNVTKYQIHNKAMKHSTSEMAKEMFISLLTSIYVLEFESYIDNVNDVVLTLANDSTIRRTFIDNSKDYSENSKIRSKTFSSYNCYIGDLKPSFYREVPEIIPPDFLFGFVFSKKETKQFIQNVFGIASKYDFDYVPTAEYLNRLTSDVNLKVSNVCFILMIDRLIRFSIFQTIVGYGTFDKLGAKTSILLTKFVMKENMFDNLKMTSYLNDFTTPIFGKLKKLKKLYDTISVYGNLNSLFYDVKDINHD